MNLPTLKPCPFCGHNVMITSRHAAAGDGGGFMAFIACYCGTFTARAHQYARADKEEDAWKQVSELWNTRAPVS